MPMIICQGAVRLDPTERDRFLEISLDVVRGTREDAGCLEYVVAPDPVDPARVVIYERWESMDDLNAHHAQARGTRDETGAPRQWPPVEDRDMTIHEVNAVSWPR